MGFFHEIPHGVERLLFPRRQTEKTAAASCIVTNLVLVVGVFLVALNTLAYGWTGTMYAQGFHLSTALDNAIPFVPGWIVVYEDVFYPFAIITIAFFSIVQFRFGYRLAWSLVIINFVAEIVYLVFPVTTDAYRDALLAHPLAGNPYAAAVYHEYATDPSFNCFPSLHAAISVICAYAWYRFARMDRSPARIAIAIAAAVIAAGVMASTLFVKQHYIADEIAGLVLAWCVGAWMWGRYGADAGGPAETLP